jgi:hypothetical protein
VRCLTGLGARCTEVVGETGGFIESDEALAAFCRDSRRLGGLTRISPSFSVLVIAGRLLRATGGVSRGRAGLGDLKEEVGDSVMRTAAL